MTLEARLSQLEDKMNITNEIPPWIQIDVMDCSKGSTDPGTPQLATIPGKIGGPCGFTLTRNEDENPDDFLDRAELEYNNFYND